MELLGKRMHHLFPVTYRTWQEDLWLYVGRVKYKGEKKGYDFCKSFPQGPRSTVLEFEALYCMGWVFLHISVPQYPALFGKWL